MEKLKTHQRDLAKLPRALAPLIERPQWAIWRWTRTSKWRVAEAAVPGARSAAEIPSSTDRSTWSDYPTGAPPSPPCRGNYLYARRAESRPPSILTVCRDADTRSIDIWAQLFLERGRNASAK